MSKKTIALAVCAALIGSAAMADAYVHYAVPAMSGIQRLKDVVPEDGVKGGAVRIVLAREEYEPGAFVIRATRDLGKTQLSLTEFKSADGGIFPAEDIDLKVVKVWYQNENAWFSYFGDTGKKLCPELLLNDEDLVRVDEKKHANYARLRSADGTARERWINPPYKLDKGYWGMWRGADSFSCMKPEFCDAETLQPVLLSKDESKCFFLTVHARRGTAAGIYRGAVKVGSFGEIPVEIRVLDFTLPRPKSYFDEAQDFLVNFYSYDCYSMIMEENGGNLERAKKQFLATMRNRVAHGEDMYWLRWNLFSSESLECIKMMQEAGMRTDWIVAPVDMPAKGATPEEMEAHFRQIAKKADEVIGHHNIYVCYGDEPGSQWLVDNRPLFRAIQKAGFRLILAGSDNIYRKAGYIYDWHNIAKTAENGTTAKMWNRLGSSAHIAWYSQEHVGPENPDFNRRQNGLAAYLSGYSAFCNYAHHYGPWNDDCSGYRPMVFSYGHARGVIDTLQWEGFREGIDDIRYATLLVRLARMAAKSSAIDTRYAGNLALEYLATIDKEADNLDACRAEMVNHILKLIGLCGAPADDPPILQAANIKDGFAPVKPFAELTLDDAAGDKGKYHDMLRWELTRGLVAAVGDKDAPAYFMNWQKVIRDWEKFRPLSIELKRTYYFGVLRAAIVAYTGLGEFDKALETVKDGQAVKRIPAERYELALMAEILALRGAKDAVSVAAKLAEVEPALAEGVPVKDRQTRFEIAASLGIISCDDVLAHGVADYYSSLLPGRDEKRRYEVGFAKGAERAPVQKLNRKYGGAGSEFLVTDVASGDRGNAASNGIDGDAPDVDMQIAADENDIRIVFTIHDEKARQYEACELDGGSFECYIAPGKNTPYSCLLVTVAENAKPYVFNTVYPGAGRRRMAPDSPVDMKSEVRYTDGEIICTVSLPWEAYAAQIPADGAEWDFEVIYWGSKACTWNGTDQVHGRSTWGRLVFKLGEEGQMKIRRKQLFKAVKAYKAEKNPRGNSPTAMRSGLFDYWKDSATGDAAFYETCLKPLEEELDAIAETIKSSMTDSEASAAYAKHFSDFHDIGYTVSRLRKRYLDDRQF